MRRCASSPSVRDRTLPVAATTLASASEASFRRPPMRALRVARSASRKRPWKAAAGALAAIPMRSLLAREHRIDNRRVTGRDDPLRLLVERCVDLCVRLADYRPPPAARSVSAVPNSILRSTSERSSTAPGAGETSGARSRASTDLPFPERPPIARRARRWRRDQLAGQPEIGLRRLRDCVLLFGPRVLQPRRRHLGADRGAQRHEQGQRRERVEIAVAASFGQVAVEHRRSRPRSGRARPDPSAGMRDRRARRRPRSAGRTRSRRTARACRRSARCCRGAGRRGRAG